MNRYFVFYKPFQVLSQFSPEAGKKTLADFFTGISRDIYPVGRLDYDSEGLLLLTNDKSFTHQLLDPKFGHERSYLVQVEGIPDEHALQQLRAGVLISVDGKRIKTKPAHAMQINAPEVPERNPPIRYRKHVPDSWIKLTLTEGRNRQVRKMTAAVGYPTLRLIRYSIGRVTTAGLQPGGFTEYGVSIKKECLRND